MTETRTPEPELIDLQLDSIRPSSTNPRQHFDPAGLDELKASIATQGVLQPLLVRRVGLEDDDSFDHYELVSGERRLRAAREVGLAAVPCIVRELTDAEAREAQIVENLQRADVHPVEEAEAYRQLIADSAAHGLGRDRTAADIARRLGKAEKHVAQMLRLLDLEIDAKLLFARGHITLEHALLLAPLTAKDQEGAIRFMLDSDPKYDKRPVTELVRGKLGMKADAAGESDEGLEEDYEPEELEPQAAPMCAKNMYTGRRLINATAAQLKGWISSHVLLQLKTAPWRLEDEGLVKLAGACDVCPKRSGSNAALFSDLTVEEDVCLDPACFAAKQKAFLGEQAKAAKEQGAPLAKLSSKRSEEKLPETVTERITLKAGQWIAAEEGSCPAAVKGILRDGAEMGKILTFCAYQKCKVHKHRVNSSASQSHAAPAETPEARDARLAADAKRMADEVAVRQAIRRAILAKAPSALVVLQRFLAGNLNDSERLICTALGLSYPGQDDPELESWDHDRAASEALAKHLFAASSVEQLASVALEGILAPGMDPTELALRSGSILKMSRAGLWASAKAFGVDADKVLGKVAGKPAKPSSKKLAVKKAAAKKAVSKKARTPKKLSEAGRVRIATAMKKRWANRSKVAK